MSKIALSGMKGRKKDTLLLASVIFLAFVFVITAIVFYGSSEKTKIEQRKIAFGEWGNAYFNGNEDVEQRLKNLDSIEKLGESRIVGRSNKLGLVGSIENELIEMGNFQFQSGGFPKNKDEIAIELNQINNLPNDFKVGDKILVEIDIPLLELSEHSVWMDSYDVLGEEFLERAKKAAEDPEDTYYEDFKDMNFETIRDPFYSLEKYFDYNWNGRNTQDFEFFNDIKIRVVKFYRYMFIDEEDEGKVSSAIESIETKGVKQRERVILSKEMTISGIMYSYSDRWDTGGYGVANAFITEESAENFIEDVLYKYDKIDEINRYNPQKNFFIVGEYSSEEFYNTYVDDFYNLRRNTYSYPSNVGSTDNILTYGILAFIFIGTIFSVFQIYLTQMRRRTRKLALLKAIGGTNGQIRKILLWEVLFLLIIILPLSIVVGLMSARVIIFLMNTYRNSQTVFHIDFKLVFLGILAGIISVFVGMILPMIKSMKVPLRGDISEAPKRKKKSTRQILKIEENHKISRQSFSQISKRHNRYNRGKNILTQSLYTLTIVVLLATIFSGFLSFDEYIHKIMIPNKPDYQIKINYGIKTSQIKDIKDKLSEVKGLENIYGYKFGEDAYLWYPGISHNPIINSYKGLLTPKMNREIFGDRENYSNIDEGNKHLVNQAMRVSSHGVEVGGEEYKNFINSITHGKIDSKAFENGEEVIVLMPMYKWYGDGVEVNRSIIENTNLKNRMAILLSEGKSYDLSYDFRDKEHYNRNYHLSVGQKIHLTVPTEDIVNNVLINDVRFIESQVAGVINYFPGKGIWPFSHTIENPVIIGSYKLIHEMYPASILGLTPEIKKDLDYTIVNLTPTRYANTLITMSTNSKFEEVKGFMDINKIAEDMDLSVTELRDDNNVIKDKALRTSIIIGVLGLSIALIIMIILYNTALSRIEQERERIGTLQALGVDGNRFKRLYFTTGIKYGLISILIAHILIALVLIITTITDVGSVSLFLQEDVLNLLKNKLWLYPWRLHISSCIVFLVWTTITYYMPIRKIVKNQAVDNIRSLIR